MEWEEGHIEMVSANIQITRTDKKKCSENMLTIATIHRVRVVSASNADIGGVTEKDTFPCRVARGSVLEKPTAQKATIE